MPVVWDAVVACTPILEDAVPRMIEWDASHPAPDSNNTEAMAVQGIPDYIKEAVAGQVKKQTGI